MVINTSVPPNRISVQLIACNSGIAGVLGVAPYWVETFNTTSKYDNELFTIAHSWWWFCFGTIWRCIINQMCCFFCKKKVKVGTIKLTNESITKSRQNLLGEDFLKLDENASFFLKMSLCGWCIYPEIDTV